MRIKLFVDAHVFDKEFQGTRTFIKGLYTQLMEREDLEIFMGAYDVENLRNNFPASERIKFLKYKTKSPFSRLLFEIPFLIRRYKIDLAHFQYVVPPIKTCKYIVTTHDVLFMEYPEEFPAFYRFIRSNSFRRSVLKADVVTTVSQYSKQSIETAFKARNKKMHVVANGISQNLVPYREKDYSEKYLFDKYGVKKYILYVSRIEPRKNHALLLKAFLELKLFEQNYHLVFIGKKTIDTKELDSALQQVPDDLRKFILQLDKVSEEELVQFYHAADLFVYPSKAEGFGIPPLEAAVAGTPVLCSSSSAMSAFDFFDQRFDPNDYEGFCEKLKAALEKKYCKEQLATLSQLVSNKYSWRNSAQQFYQLIKSNHS